MKHKVLLISVSTIGISFLIVLISSLIIGNSLDLNTEMEKLLTFNQGNPNFKNYLQTIIDENKISNIFEFATFSFWIDGASTNLTIHTFKTASFILLWGFAFPILSIILSLLISIWVVLIFNERIRREYKYKILKSTGKWGMYSSVLVLILFTTIFIILIGILEGQFDQLDFENKVVKDTIKNSSSYSDRVLLATIVTMIFNGIGGVNKNIIDPNIVNMSLLITALVFLTVFMTISVITTIGFSSIWIATFISHRNNSLSKFTRWLGNVRIDSKREFREIILKNVYFWILLSLLALTLIYPGLVHTHETTTQIIISIVSILLVPVALVPTFIAMITISRIRMFNYNLMMFLQILVFSIIISSQQIVIWLLFSDQIIGMVWIKFAMPFYTTMASMVCLFGFIKWRS